jgi:hypothetical protein
VMTWMPRKEGAKSGERHSLSTREPIGCACTNRHALSGAPLFSSGDFGCEGNKYLLSFCEKFGSELAKNSLFLQKKRFASACLPTLNFFFVLHATSQILYFSPILLYEILIAIQSKAADKIKT